MALLMGELGEQISPRQKTSAAGPALRTRLDAQLLAQLRRHRPGQQVAAR